MLKYSIKYMSIFPRKIVVKLNKTIVINFSTPLLLHLAVKKPKTSTHCYKNNSGAFRENWQHFPSPNCASLELAFT